MRRLSLPLLALALSLTSLSSPPFARAQSVATVKVKLGNLRQQIARERQIQALRQAQASSAYAGFHQAVLAFDASQARLNALGQELATLAAEESRARAALAAADHSAAVARGRLRATEIGWQEEGALGPFALLLGAHSLSAFFARLYEVNQVIGYQGAQMHSLALSIARAKAQSRLLARQARSAAAAQAAAHAAAASIQRQGQVERAAMAHDKALVAAASGTLEQLEEASAALVRILEQQRHASTVAVAQVGQSLRNVRFQWPVNGPITSPFGMRLDPVTHQYWLHSGVDIGVPAGTPVHAACGGTVLYSGWMTGYGNVVILDCGQGISTLYAHAETLLVQVGQAVAQGQEIDLAGMTGWATGPHLHFEIRVNGTPINPLPYLPGG